MLAFAYYLLKITICAAVLFIYYWFLLRNKVFHAYNRFYLLAIVGISILLPLFSINIFHKPETTKTSVIKMLTVVTESDDFMGEVIIQAKPPSAFTLMSILPFCYLLISAILLFLLLQMLIKIFMLSKSNESKRIENILFVNTDAAKGTPFSFFNSIFWNKQISLHSTAGARIFKHELAHIQQRHSYDKLFMNIILILFWANPVYWIIRKELSMIHEFIADKIAVEDGDTAAFAAMILATTYPNHTMTLTNNFFYSPIKRRLMMLTKNQHPKINYLSRLLVLPLALIVFAAFSLKAREYKSKQSEIAINSKNTNQQSEIDQIQNTNADGAQKNKSFTNDKTNLQTDKQITVVLDAGHGGQDAGAVNKNGLAEKELTLQLIKKIKEANKNEQIKIILTRESDVFQDIKQKAIFAKEQNPDLFISIHLDNTPKQKWNTESGMKVYVAKDEFANCEKSKLFASAIIGAFQNNYALSVNANPTQRQYGIWILQANSFPSVLIEAGYLSNDADAAYLLSVKGQETFANNVLNAINNFAKSQAFQSNSFSQIPTNDIANENTTNDRAKLKASLDKASMINADEQYVVNASQFPNSLNLNRGFGKDSNGYLTLLNGTIASPNFIKEGIRDNDKISVYTPNEAYSKFKIKSNSKVINITRNYSEDSGRSLVISQTQTQPAFPGGIDAWKKFLQQKVNGLIPIDENWAIGTYNILVKFIVEKDGSLSNISTVNYIGSKTAQHCIDVIKNGPKWIPAKQNGKAVAAHFTQPITFVITDGEDAKKVVQNIDPVFRIGNYTSGRIKAEEFKKQQFATVTDDYEFVSCNVYFGGVGFAIVGSAKMVGSDFTQLSSFLEKCAPGTSIAFTNIKVKNGSGMRTIEEKAYTLY